MSQTHRATGFKPVADQVRAISHDNQESLDARPVRALNDVSMIGCRESQPKVWKTAGDCPDSRPVAGSENETLVLLLVIGYPSTSNPERPVWSGH